MIRMVKLGELAAVLLVCLFLTSCGSQTTTAQQRSGYVDLGLEDFIQKAKEDANGVLLDVRTPGETMKGMIPGAVELDYRSHDFEQKVEALDKNKTYYIYCHSGGRSAQACAYMAQKGFQKLYNLPGGHLGYKKNMGR